MLENSDDNQSSRSGYRIAPGLKLVAIALISIALMMADYTHGSLSTARSVLSVILEPVQVVAELPGDISNYLAKYFDRSQLIRKNRQLSQKILLLQGEMQQLAALKAENERIRALMASASQLDRNVLIARILSIAPEPYRQYVVLDKGSADGVFVGQALIDSHGIVGQVTRVTPISSRAMLITDPNTGIPVQDNDTGLLTIAQGTGNAHKLTLPYLPHNADIHVGDLLISSGLGDRYPANYPVARVTHISRESGSEFLDVEAKPTARLDRGREVLLIWKTQPAHRDSKHRNSASSTPSKQSAAREMAGKADE